MKERPKKLLLEAIVAQRGERGLDSLRPVPGFPGYFMAISTKPFRWQVDGTTLESADPVAVLTTSKVDRIQLLAPWRNKYRGKPYGGAWVALRGPDGKRHQVRVEKLAEETFGPLWQRTKEEIANKAFQSTLQELL